MNRRIISTLASVTAVLAATSVVVTAPVHAAPFTVANCGSALNGQNFSIPTGTQNTAIIFTTPCQGNTPPASTPPTQNPPNFAISNSPTFNWYNDEIRVNGSILVKSNYSAGSPETVTIQISNTVVMAPIADGTYTVYFASFPVNTTPVDSGSFTIVVGAGGSSSSSGTTGSSPSPVLQQFGKPATGTCDAAQPEMLNIGGAESGGWSESWAEWMNSGLGGAVCTRTLVYSNALGHWVVG